MRSAIVTATILVLLLSGTTGYFVIHHYQPPPAIQGAYLQPARSLDSFRLLDHDRQPFAKEQLKGRWHLVSYGYTHCPDICPMTLAQLAQFKQALKQAERHSDLQILFYSVDHERDSPEHLKPYVGYFDKTFIGLTRPEAPDSGHRNFERSLGIMAQVELAENIVNHGVMLMLLNPKAQLQAVFRPEPNEHGLYHFTQEQLLQDYLAVRDHYAKPLP